MSKNILVTGVSQGLGLAIAAAVLAEGWSLYGISRSRSPAFTALLDAHPGRVHHLGFDLSKPDGIKEAVFGAFLPLDVPVHGVVNNAAVAYDDLTSNLDLDRLQDMYAVNVFAPMVITKQAIRNMLLHRVAGSLVHISSISVHTGYKGLAMYASSKGALEAFSKNVAREWGERGIRSNCVVAGFMETAMTSALSDPQREKIYNRTALKRAVEAESVASSVAYLLGDRARSITGQNIVVDSGTI